MRSKLMTCTPIDVTEAQERRLRKAGFAPVISWVRPPREGAWIDLPRYTTAEAEELAEAVVRMAKIKKVSK